jgi:transposase
MPEKHNIVASLPLIEPNAAGIDVGATETSIAVPTDRNPEPIRTYPTSIADLEIIADWLDQCQIRTVHPNRCLLL